MLIGDTDSLLLHDESGVGSTVTLVRITFDDDIVRERMPALFATMALLCDEDNGVKYKSARIFYGGVPDDWGMSV